MVTIPKAIDNDQLKTFPGLEQSLLEHLTTSTATVKGHMHKHQKGVQSTISNQEDIKEAGKYLAEMNPSELICATLEWNVFCNAALVDTVTGNIYTDPPGRFPV